MKLKEYLKEHRWTLTQVAAKIGCHRNYLSNIASGKLVPGTRLAFKIEEFTNGEVTIKDLLRAEEEYKLNKVKTCPEHES